MTEPLDDARGELLACPFCGVLNLVDPDTRPAPVPQCDAESREVVNLGRVFAVTNLTEHQDVSFFLERWGACENVDEKRQLIRSFRNQIINVAAGEMSALSPHPGTVAVASTNRETP